MRFESLGARRIDVDSLGHRVLAGTDVRDAVAAVFGGGVLAADGSVDRRALASVAFASDANRTRLEAIVHPAVRRRIDAEMADARTSGAPLIVMDCALLFESGLDSLCDATLAVDAPETVRLARARAAHGWDESEVRRRTAAQLPASEKCARAGRVFVNDGDEARLDVEAREVFETVLRGDRVAAARRTSP
jgi:dephospho-CoA kinase